MGRFKRLVVPGRFQPLHQGHLHTIQYALDNADEVIVVIGSAQESFTLKNPLTAGERFEMLDIALRSIFGDDYRSRILIVPVMDIAMNKVWVQYLKMLLPRFDGVVSGNELVRILFEDMGLAALKPPIVNRDYCSGTRIRDLVLKGVEEWKKCVPGVVQEYLSRIGFVERLRRLASGG
ncbi:MAG: nicotinamide-nucleotide adenylyltransferase [Desulfurococcales archaeon]|nr:nicotinamide-nucleotide adenylyltransferase [Desulfurococcales archaeon]